MTTEKKSITRTILIVLVVVGIGAGIAWRWYGLAERAEVLDVQASADTWRGFRLQDSYDPVEAAVYRGRRDNEIWHAQQAADDWFAILSLYVGFFSLVGIMRFLVVPTLSRKMERERAEREAKGDYGIDPSEVVRSVSSGLAAAATSIKKAIPRQPTTGGGRHSTADELRKWADLRDEGLVTEEEFQKMRDKLVG